MPRYPAELKAEAERLYIEEELSAAAVAAALGLKKFTVKDWLAAKGMTRSMSEAAAISAARQHRNRAQPGLWYRSARTGETIFAGSSLEYLRMEQLDGDANVAAWERCRLRVPYIDPVTGKRRHYVPDLTVTSDDGQFRIEEIKPSAMTTDPVNVAKFSAAAAMCTALGWTFHVLSEKHVGYARRIAPSHLTKEEKLKRSNDQRRKRWANETPEQRARRLAKNAKYMREFEKRRKPRDRSHRRKS